MNYTSGSLYFGSLEFASLSVMNRFSCIIHVTDRRELKLSYAYFAGAPLFQEKNRLPGDVFQRNERSPLAPRYTYSYILARLDRRGAGRTPMLKNRMSSEQMKKKARSNRMFHTAITCARSESGSFNAGWSPATAAYEYYMHIIRTIEILVFR